MVSLACCISKADITCFYVSGNVMIWIGRHAIIRQFIASSGFGSLWLIFPECPVIKPPSAPNFYHPFIYALDEASHKGM
jgi:hypothetical protein